MPAGVGDKATRGVMWAEEEGRPQQAVYCRAEDETGCGGEEGDGLQPPCFPGVPFWLD